MQYKVIHFPPFCCTRVVCVVILANKLGNQFQYRNIRNDFAQLEVNSGS